MEPWTRGPFQVEIDELPVKDGRLRIVGCFDNGAVIGKNGGFGLSKGFVKKYRFNEDGFALEKEGGS